MGTGMRELSQRKLKHQCSNSYERPDGEYQCEFAGVVERDGRWFCRRHDPVRRSQLPRCSGTNSMGQACGTTATVERNGLLYCGWHDPDPATRQKELAIKKDADLLEKERVSTENDGKMWAEATAFADAEGVRVLLIREDVLSIIVSHLSNLPYRDVNELIRMIKALPEAPIAGRWRVASAYQDAPTSPGRIDATTLRADPIPHISHRCADDC